MDAALGCKTDVFQVQRSNNSKQIQISINPQAAHIVCRHVLDTLIALAKSFPYQFLPDTLKDPNELKSTSNNGNQSNTSTPHQSTARKSALALSAAYRRPTLQSRSWTLSSRIRWPCKTSTLRRLLLPTTPKSDQRCGTMLKQTGTLKFILHLRVTLLCWRGF